MLVWIIYLEFEVNELQINDAIALELCYLAIFVVEHSDLVRTLYWLFHFKATE